MALLGEWQFGAGENCSDLVMVTIGTGIGTAVLINGQLLKGKHFQAGNLGGHFVVNYKGTTCTCGNIGCVEAEASTWRLPSLLEPCMSAWSAGIITMIPAFDPEMIILSGGIMKSASMFFLLFRKK